MAVYNHCKSLFKDYLKLLQFSPTFEVFSEEATRILTSLKHLHTSQINKIRISALRVDRVAETVVPKEYQSEIVHVKPIISTGDGNCLFNSASIAVTGSEIISAELRLRTCIELALHHKFYSDHPILRGNNILSSKSRKRLNSDIIYEAIILSNSSNEILSKEGDLGRAIQHEIMQTSKNGNFSGIMQIMGLATVMHCNIDMIFPDNRHKLYSILGGEFQPRAKPQVHSNHTIFILWTNCSGWIDRDREFIANHFVPMLPVCADNESLASCAVSESIVEKTIDGNKKMVTSKIPHEEPSGSRWVSFEEPPSERNTKSISSFILSMPILSQQWYSTEGFHFQEPTENNLTSMPLLSSNYYGKVGASSLSEQNFEEIQCSGDSLSENDSSLNHLSMPKLSKSFLSKRGKLAVHNWQRKKKREEMVLNNAEVLTGNVTGTLESNILDISVKLLKEKNPQKRANLHAVKTVAELVASHLIVPTQEAGTLYRNEKSKYLTNIVDDKDLKIRTASSRYFSIFAEYLNIIQIYLYDKAYLIDGKFKCVDDVMSRLQSSIPIDKLLNDRLHNKLSILFKSSLNTMSTKADRDILKGLLANATSANFSTKLQGVQDKRAMMNCRDSLSETLSNVEIIKQTSQIVRNDMTAQQQMRLTKRIIAKRKNKEMRLQHDSRGRTLKCEQWPELAATMEYIFGENDILNRSGGVGGLECHPKLKNSIMYRNEGNVTTMREAVAIVNAISPPSFNISLSACYNYTMGYKINSASAKRHHHGKTVNANISLHAPSRTNVDKLVVNLHFSTSLVNFLCDFAHKNAENTLVDSKDAKKILCAEITPVQKPGRVWTEKLYPDHDWDQSRTNAVTPMTHLFLKTVVTKTTPTLSSSVQLQDVYLHLPLQENAVMHVTRTGKAVTLIGLSLYESESTIRLFNEIFFLLSKPSLDVFFRNPCTGNLKSVFLFIVDNGPAEDPSSPLVQMLLARMRNFLNLDKVIQTSFAEYHSKRNFVERVHAIEDAAFSRHGPFSSSQIHKSPYIKPGSVEHMENMEKMASDVVNCLKQTTFGGEPLESFRGIKESSYIFNDEKKLKQFLSLSEERKLEFEETYSVDSGNGLLDELSDRWGISKNFTKAYLNDYHVMTNSSPTSSCKTSWVGKYIACFYRTDEKWQETNLKRKELQPIPDYMRWLQTNGELHYLTLERTARISEGQWSESPDLFCPSILLDTFISLDCSPPEYVYTYIALLVWLPEGLVREYFKLKANSIENDLSEDMLREKWRKHPLYSKSQMTLTTMCKEMGLLSKGAKHHLVQHLVEHFLKNGKECAPIPGDFVCDYNGNFESLPALISQLKKFSVAKLRYILHFHNLPVVGVKEDLVLCLFLLKQNKYHLAFKQQEDKLLATISIAEQTILREKCQNILHPKDTYRQRTNASKHIVKNHNLPVPAHIQEDNLQELFVPLRRYLMSLKGQRRAKAREVVKSNGGLNQGTLPYDNDNNEEYFDIGRTVMIKWTRDEIGDSGWKPGWYKAVVQSSSLQEDNINIEYISEPECVYTIPVTQYISVGKLKLAVSKSS